MNSTIRSDIIGRWIHLPSEDTKEELTYRLDNRDENNQSNGFELKENGEFIKFNFSDGDLRIEKGNFEIHDNFIYVTFPNSYKDFMINIQSHSNNILKVKKWQ